MPAHTPGPWTVENIMGVEVHGMVRPFRSVEAPGYSAGGGIALVHISAHPEQALANARLIAAAPALLKALEAIVNTLEVLADDGRPIPGYAWKTVDKACAAIRAAKGETA